MTVSQPELIGAVLMWLDRRGVKEVNARQMTAVIRAATDICDALDRPHTPAAPGGGLRAWLASDDTGLSSLYMAHALAPQAGLAAPQPDLRFERHPRPHDPADFRRCVGLLAAVPEFRPLVGRMADGHGPAWAALAGAWAELEALYREEVPTGKAPRLWAKMRELTEGTP